MAGRHSRRFYEHTTRWVVNEVALERARREGSGGLLRRSKWQLNAWRGRLGMRLTRHQREEGQRSGSGRGWPAGRRAADGW